MSDGAAQLLQLPNDERFDLALSLEPQDFVQFEREYFGRHHSAMPSVLIVPGILALCLLCIVVGFALGRAPPGELLRLGVVALSGFAVVGIAHALGWLTTKVPESLRRPIDTGGWHVVTTIDGLLLESLASSQVWRWSELKGMIVSEDAIYLALSTHRAIMLPRRVFADREDFVAFRSVIAKYAQI